MPHPQPYWRRLALVVTPAPVFTAQAAPGGTVGAAYTYAFIATNTASYALGTGSLPAGLTLSGGVLSGTPITAAGYTFTVVATGGGGSTSSTSQSVTIAASGTGAMTITGNPPTFDAAGNALSSITGYYFLWDTQSRAVFGGYANQVYFSGGNPVTGLTISTLPNGQTIYAAIAAYDGTNQGSPSQEVSKLV